eukprot:Em0021g900a
MKTEKKRRADVAKMWRLRCNWIYTMVVTALVCVGYATPFSTLHQFITYPQENRTGTETAHVFTIFQLGTSGLGTTGLGTSGLGESEIVYAWIVAMYSVGETIAAVGTGVLLHYFSYWSCYMFSVFLHLVGGVIYGLATNGVMMLVSRLLIGAHAGLGWFLAVAYYGERCEEYDQLKLELKGMREDRGVGEEDGRTVMEGKDGSSVEGNNGRNVEGKDGRNVEGKDGRNEEGKDGRNVEGNDGRNMVGEEDNCTEIGTNQAMEIVSGRKPEEQNDEGSSEYANTTDTVVAAKVKHVIRTKDLLHSLFAISNSLVSGFSVVLVILLQMIPGVDKFRIVGWINAVLAAGVMVLQLFMFRGEGYCTRDNRKVCKVLLGCLQIPWKCHRPGRKTMFLCVLVMVFYTIDSGYNIIDTLSNPILTNQFAFTVEDSGYFFAVATFGFAIGTLIFTTLISLQYHPTTTDLLTVSPDLLTYPPYHPDLLAVPPYHPDLLTVPPYHPDLLTVSPDLLTVRPYHPDLLTVPPYHPDLFAVPPYHPDLLASTTPYHLISLQRTILPPDLPYSTTLISLQYHPYLLTVPPYHPDLLAVPPYHPDLLTVPPYHPDLLTVSPDLLTYHPTTLISLQYHPTTLISLQYHPTTLISYSTTLISLQYHPDLLTVPPYHPDLLAVPPTTLISLQYHPITLISLQYHPTTLISLQYHPTTLISLQYHPDLLAVPPYHPDLLAVPPYHRSPCSTTLSP